MVFFENIKNIVSCLQQICITSDLVNKTYGLRFISFLSVKNGTHTDVRPLWPWVAEQQKASFVTCAVLTYRWRCRALLCPPHQT